MVAFIRGNQPFQHPAFSVTFYEDLSALERLTQAINVALQAAEGLAFVHEKKRVHKDIKPKNFAESKGQINLNGSVNLLTWDSLDAL